MLLRDVLSHVWPTIRESTIACTRRLRSAQRCSMWHAPNAPRSKPESGNEFRVYNFGKSRRRTLEESRYGVQLPFPFCGSVKPHSRRRSDQRHRRVGSFGTCPDTADASNKIRARHRFRRPDAEAIQGSRPRGHLKAIHPGDKNLTRNAKLVESMELDDKQVLDPEHIRLGHLLGEGGFAKVYQCQLAGQTAVAKVIPSEQLNEEMTYLLTNECTIWARLAHDNIVAFYGMASTAQSVWLVCESMTEGSLQSRLEEQRAAKAEQPSMHQLVDQYTQIASGMQYLHKFDPPVLHRDLKSANILLGNSGKRLAIADFGLARYQAGPGKKMTAETGSYRWMAPRSFGTKCMPRRATSTRLRYSRGRF